MPDTTLHELPFARLWAARHPESLEEVRRFWDLRADEFNDITHDKDKMERLELIGYLQDKGALREDFSVLDLGCGAGRFALEFAARSATVTGVDISPQMIAYAENNAMEARLANARFLTMPWQEVDLDALGFRGAFDLVFSSMSQAVNSEETLLRMHAASRGYCFLSGFIHRADLLERSLAGRIRPGYEPPHIEGSIYYAFNILWQHGIYADVLCKDVFWTNMWDVEHAVTVYGKQLAALGGDPESLREALRRHILTGARDGKVKRKMSAKVAWLFWKK